MFVLKKIEKIRKQIDSYPKFLVFLAACFFFFYRLIFLPGLEFNSQLWDDEVGWDKDYQERNFLQWFTYRDAPGYFVFLPRLLLLGAHLVPDSIFPDTLRISLIVINLICVFFAMKVLVSHSNSWSSAVLVYCCFCSIYIEDLNYLHNISYFFIFPILFLLQRLYQRASKSQFISVALIVLLINKPIISILLVALLMYLSFIPKFPRRALIFLAAYNVFYLGCYVFLPNRWETPTNTDFMTIKPLLLNVPWVLGMVLLPLIYIGLNGFLHLVNLDLLRNFLGVFLYTLPILPIFFLRSRSIRIRRIKARGSHRLHIGLILLVSSYLMVYINFDSYWIKAFPLYSLNVPQHLWNRWSSLIPILFLAVLWELGKIYGAQKWVRLIFWLVMLQEFAFQISAYPWLRRWW